MHITWNKNILDGHKREIENCISPLLWIIPKWCGFMHINLFDQHEDGALATVYVDYTYRRITINFFARWLTETPKERFFTVIHEFIHTNTAIIADYARDTFNTLCPSDEAGRFNKSIQEELITRHESATQDLAIAIFNQLYQEREVLN